MKPFPWDNPHMQRYQKAKRLQWDPQAISLERDRHDWPTLTPDEQDSLRRGALMFLLGEHSVASELAPLLIAMQRRGRTAEAFFLSSQLWEETKHTEFFQRYLEVVTGQGAVEGSAGSSHVRLFDEELPAILQRVLDDPSDESVVRAVTTYHLVVEGTLAETGYHGFYQCIKGRGILPGLLKGIELVQRDEARHVSFGIDLLADLLKRNPDLQAVCEQRVDDLLPLVLGVLADYFAPYGEENAFGLSMAEMIDFATRQLGKRLAALDASTTIEKEPI